MFANIASIAAIAMLIVPALAMDAAAPASAPASAQGHVAYTKRCGSCGGWGGCGSCGGWGGLGGWGFGGWGVPFATSATNAFNNNCNRACCNDNTLYVNNKHGDSACNNVNNFNNVNTIV